MSEGFRSKFLFLFVQSIQKKMRWTWRVVRKEKSTYSQTEPNTRVNGKISSDMVMGFKYGQTVLVMRVLK